MVIDPTSRAFRAQEHLRRARARRRHRAIFWIAVAAVVAWVVYSNSRFGSTRSGEQGSVVVIGGAVAS